MVVHKNPEKSGLYISRVRSYLIVCPFVLCSCRKSMSLITSLLMSDARPDSSSASTVDDKCLPILSAAKNMYLGLMYGGIYSGEICFARPASLEIWAITLVSRVFQFLMFGINHYISAIRD